MSEELLKLRSRIDQVTDPGFYKNELTLVYSGAVAAYERLQEFPNDDFFIWDYHTYVGELRYLLDKGDVPGVFHDARWAGLEAGKRVRRQTQKNRVPCYE